MNCSTLSGLWKQIAVHKSLEDYEVKGKEVLQRVQQCDALSDIRQRDLEDLLEYSSF
jgi:hypothetical protein